MIRFRKAKGIKSIERDYKKILTADYSKDFVEVERFIECCKFCPNYGAKWGCPPYTFDVKEKYWNGYKYLHLFSFKMYLEDDVVEHGMTEEEIAKMGEKARARVKEAYSWQYICDKYNDAFLN